MVRPQRDASQPPPPEPTEPRADGQEDGAQPTCDTPPTRPDDISGEQSGGDQTLDHVEAETEQTLDPVEPDIGRTAGGSDQTRVEPEYASPADKTLEYSADAQPQSLSRAHTQRDVHDEFDVKLPGSEFKIDRSGRLRQVGRYQVISILGEGAFGKVFRCRDPHLDRIVAVKVSKGTLGTSQQEVNRFLREAKSAAQLRHPNIIPVFEYGSAGTSHYIAYQFIEGQTLKSWLRQHRDAPLAKKIELIAQVAEALDYAHRSGIVHRDIKPENILVDGRETPHIADFGCARLDTSEVTQTIDGTLMGTPAFMSPEQAAGRAHAADGRSDLWSLGVMLYEILTGTLPFRGDLTRIFQAIRNEEPKLPRHIVPSTPLDLETICLKLLRKNVDSRFQTGKELADELRRWQRGEPIQSRRISTLTRVRLWARRNPAVASLLGLVVMVLGLGLLASTLFTIQLSNKQAALVRSQIESLQFADASTVPLIIDNLKTLGPQTVGRLRALLRSEELTAAQAGRVRLAILQLDARDAQQREELARALVDDLNSAEPHELAILLPLLQPDSSLFASHYWQIALDPQNDGGQQLRAASALAQFDPKNELWSKLRQPIIGQLLAEETSTLDDWALTLRPVRDQLRAELEQVFSGGNQAETREAAARVLARLFANDSAYLCGLAAEAKPNQLRQLIREVRQDQDAARDLLRQQLHRARAALPIGSADQQACNALLMLAMLDNETPLQQELSNLTDPTVRTMAIHQIGEAGIGASSIERLLQPGAGRDAPNLVAAIQSLGEFGEQDLYPTQRQRVVPALLRLFQTHPDPGVHSSAAWLLRKWGFAQQLQTARDELVSPQPLAGMGWHEDPNGLCFALFGPVEQFAMGQPGSQQTDDDSPTFHQRRIPRRVGISTLEITARQYLQYESELMQTWEQHQQDLQRDGKTEEAEKVADRISKLQRQQKNRQLDPGNDLPMANITWVDAASFCNWLTRKADFPEEQVCYPEIERFSGTSVPRQSYDEYLPREGYRLPTMGEWEFGCRAGAQTTYHFGRDPRWLGSYAWTIENSGEQRQAVGLLKPNDLGIFDIHGNVAEWCHNFAAPIDPLAEMPISDEDASETRQLVQREVRGGSYFDESSRISSFARHRDMPVNGFNWRGFRIARTYGH